MSATLRAINEMYILKVASSTPCVGHSSFKKIDPERIEALKKIIERRSICAETRRERRTRGGGVRKITEFPDDGTAWDTKKKMPTKLRVTKMTKRVTRSRFRKYFQKYGEIVSVFLPLNKNKKSVKGYGFITFADMDCVNRVLAVKEHVLDKTVISVQQYI